MATSFNIFLKQYFIAKTFQLANMQLQKWQSSVVKQVSGFYPEGIALKSSIQHDPLCISSMIFHTQTHSNFFKPILLNRFSFKF